MDPLTHFDQQLGLLIFISTSISSHLSRAYNKNTSLPPLEQSMQLSSDISLVPDHENHHHIHSDTPVGARHSKLSSQEDMVC